MLEGMSHADGPSINKLNVFYVGGALTTDSENAPINSAVPLGPTQSTGGLYVTHPLLEAAQGRGVIVRLSAAGSIANLQVTINQVEPTVNTPLTSQTGVTTLAFGTPLIFRLFSNGHKVDIPHAAGSSIGITIVGTPTIDVEADVEVQYMLYGITD